METFFNPRAVAVIGAGTKNLGNHVVQNLINGFQGGIFPVNRNYQEIEGLPCFASMTAIPDPVDLAIVLVPAAAVPSVLKDCAAKGTRRVIIESAGFAESGRDGIALQERCAAIAKEAGMRLWGPNCMGIVDVRKQNFFTFMHPGIRAEGLLPGRISLIVQSGMMSAVFLAELARRGIGVSKACSIGNRSDVDECDILPYLQQDPDTDVIAMYLESIPRGRLFARLAQTSAKPIVLLKGGQSQAGAIAAMSHTYSLSGNSRLLNSILSLAGVTQVDSIFEMMETAKTLAAIPRINPQCRAAIVTLSGGAGILACDALEKNGIRIAALSDKTKMEIGRVFPPWMQVANPIDLFPAVSMHDRRTTIETALAWVFADPGVDVLVIHYVAGVDEAPPDLQELKRRLAPTGKAVVFWLMGRREASRRFREKAGEAGIPVHDDAVRVAQGLAAVSRFQAYKADPMITPDEQAPGRMDARPLPSQEATWDEYDSKRLLADWGIPVVQEQLVCDPDQAWQIAQRIGPPVVLKGLLPGKAHKTEHGLVKLNISDPARLQTAFDTLRRQMDHQGRVLMQKQASIDYELIAGFIRDDQFGPCVMFGLGGILAELEPDVRFAMAPLNRAGAIKLMRSLRNRKLMQGFRGLRPIEEETMAEILVRLGDLGSAYPQIAQIDINPLVVSEGKPLAVDANVILKQG
ncbi:MAG: CoA-binding protein [Desulfobacteraceae bacterium]|nr:MAG: CoA-binding protein [Desulfobacteraceae bacterium]